MRLFTKDIDKQLFAQYPKGGDLENQKVVAKIFNPYGNGTWYLVNSDPNDSDYLWAIVDLFEVEVGSVSRMDLETIKAPPFRLGLERDMSFTPINAQELFDGLLQGKHYAHGGMMDANAQNKAMLLNQAEGFEHHAEEFESAVKKADEIPAWVVAKSQRASTDLSDITHYLDGENEQKREMKEGEEYGKGGEFGVDKHRIYFSSFAEVMEAINDIANENGYDVVDIFPDLSYGGVGYGQTKRAKVELEWNGKDKMGKSKKREKNTLNVQIYRMDSGNYELNSYFSYAYGGYMAKGGVIGNYELMPYIKGVNDTYNPKYQAKEYFEGTKDDAIEKANSMLSAEIGMVQVSIVNPKATNVLNRTKKIATVVYKDGGYMASGGSVDNWVLYDNDTDEIISFHKSAKSAKSAANKILDAPIPKHKEVGFMLESNWNKEKEAIKKAQELRKHNKMAMGGETFDSKVKSIKSRLLENKKVSPSVQKDYGKTYSPKEAEESAKRIVGAMTAKERLKMRMAKNKKK